MDISFHIPMWALMIGGSVIGGFFAILFILYVRDLIFTVLGGGTSGKR